MRILFLVRFIYVCLLLCSFTTAATAQLYPGDANNDGRINNIDILYVGYAYGSYGPTRIDTTVDYAEVAVPLLWDVQFPDSTNYAFADADGNGLIDFADFLAVHLNYGSKRANPQMPTFLVGMSDFDPQLRLGTPLNNPLIKEGDAIDIPVFLEGADGDTLASVNGIAFSLDFDRRFFKEVRIDFLQSWLGQDSAFFTYQASAFNKLEVAVTRFGKNPVKGKGKIGVVKAIIEDDVIGFLARDSAQVHLKVEYIKLVDGNFLDIATSSSETTFTIYDSDAIVSTSETPLDGLIQVFPNPASGELQIRSPAAIQRMEIFDAQGRPLARWQLQAAYSLGISLSNQPPGLIFIKIHTEKGLVIRKVIIR